MTSTTSTVLLGRYELREPHGHGRCGPVWRAHDLLLRRDVAVTTVPTSRDRDPDGARWRAHHGGRAAARVHHPSLAALFDMAEVDGDVVLVSELLRGRPLGEVLDTVGPLAPSVVAALGARLAGALAAAHAGGVVLGDVTPATVLLGVTAAGLPDGTAALSGFGVPLLDTGPGGPAPGPFTPPELVGGAPAMPPSNVWALGATLATALDGRPPYGPVASSSWGALGPLLVATLAPDPAARPEARAVRSALEAMVDELSSGSGDHGARDEEIGTAPQPRVPAAVGNPPTRTWTPRTGPTPAARPRRRLVGAGVVGAGLLVAGTAGVVAASISESASESGSTTSAAALPAPAPAAPAPAEPVVTAPITPVDPPPPIAAVPMDADPMLTAASSDAPRARAADRDDEDRDRAERRRSDRDDADRDDADRDDAERHDRSDRSSDDDRHGRHDRSERKDHDSDDGDRSDRSDRSDRGDSDD